MSKYRLSRKILTTASVIVPSILMLFFSCTSSPKMEEQEKTPYERDVEFFSKHLQFIELQAPDNNESRILVVPAYQARVMTSTGGGAPGKSYGWINYKHIESKQILPHMNAFGGEERIWLAPEGGQFSIFFKPGDPFDFEHWQTPPLIDTATFELESNTPSQATFRKRARLVNYSGTNFDIELQRAISVLDRASIQEKLGIELGDSIRWVAYQSENRLTNLGEDWTKASGTLGIWILGMFKPSENTTLVAPFTPADHLYLTDDYFGKVPPDRLKMVDATILFKGDGKFRSKIGLAPTSVKPIAAAWDAENGVLTLVQFDLDMEGDYLKATWEIHEDPYSGDAFNAYNDGPTEDGTQMGPFVELESTSSTRALKKDETLVHRHTTFHFEGERQALEEIAQSILGIGLEDIENAFR